MNTKRSLGRSFLCVLIAALLVSTAAADDVGFTLRARQSVREKIPGSDGSTKVREDYPIQFGSTIYTGSGANFEMRFNLKSGTLQLGPESQVTIDRLTGEDRIRIFSPIGRLILFLTGFLHKKIDLESPDSKVFKLNGTAIHMIVEPEVGTWVAVLEGLATVQSKVVGEPVEVPAGTFTFVAQGKAPTLPAPLRRGFGLSPGEKIPEDSTLCCPNIDLPKPTPP